MKMNYVKILKCLLFCLFAPVVLFSNIQSAKETNTMKNYLYDSNHVRYELYQTNEGKPYNWLLLPGGPGADSSYLHSLVDELELPGNVWLIDMPGNGSNISEDFSENYDRWIHLFPSIIQQFDNPV